MSCDKKEDIKIEFFWRETQLKCLMNVFWRKRTLVLTNSLKSLRYKLLFKVFGSENYISVQLIL